MQGGVLDLTPPTSGGTVLTLGNRQLVLSVLK